MGIPDSVTSIGDYAFAWCSLTSVTIPDSVTSIGEGAFYVCYSLEDITIPDSVTSIGDRAFHRCSSLESIIIPGSVTSIGESTFSCCNSLTSVTIPGSVTSIGDEAFGVCSSLESITIPSSVTSIGDGAFQSCSSLTNVTISGGVTSIGDSVFGFCSSLTNVTIPDSVTSIGDGAFGYCSNLTSITIPGSVTNIRDYTFSGCSGLTSVTIPGNIASIGNDAFSNCSSLTSFQIALTEAEDIVVPIIGEHCFDYCPADRYLTFLTEDGITELSDKTTPTLAAAVAAYKAVEDGNTTDDLWYGWKLPEATSVTGYSLIINVNIDDSSWDNHKRQFALSADNGAAFITDFTGLSNGKYTIYDRTGVTDSTDYVNTGVTVEVNGADATATVDYYTVTFHDGDTAYGADSDQAPQVVLSGQTAKEPDTPTKTGYTFDKWVTENNGTDEFNFTSTNITRQTDIYASWTRNAAPTYTVTINVNKDDREWENHGKSFCLKAGGREDWITDLNAVEAGTYDIYDVTGGDAKIDTGIDVTVTNSNIEATVDYYTVTFHDGDTAYGADSDHAPQVVLSGQTAKEPDTPTKTGYTFDKWVTENNGTDEFNFTSTNITRQTDIYASWTENAVPKYQVTIKVHKDDAEWENHGKTFRLKKENMDTSITGLAAAGAGIYMVYENEKTDAWIPNLNGVEAGTYRIFDVTDNTVVDTNVIVTVASDGDNTAAIHYYTVTFYAAAKDETDENTAPYKEETALKNAKISAPDHPTKDGYTFNKWMSETENEEMQEFDFATAITKPTIIYASWTKNNSSEESSESEKSSESVESLDDNSNNKGSSGSSQNDSDDRPGSSDNSTSVTTDSRPVINSDTSVITDTDIVIDDNTAPASKDNEPKTGDVSHTEIYAIIAMIAGLSYLMLYFADGRSGMTEEEKKL